MSGHEGEQRTGGRIPPAGEEERVRSLLRALPEPRPSDAFRNRMRQEFVAGRLAPRAAAGAGARRRWLDRLLRPGWIAIPAVLAASVALVLLTNRGPSWQLLDGPHEGSIRIDGRTVALSDRSTLGKLLTGGARVDLADSVLVTIASAENVYLQILPGTQMDIPPAPGRWFGRDVHASIATGEVRITTGPRFPGARLTVETPEVAVVVSGTTVAVIRPPFGTCVCVLEGTVEVSVLGSGSSERVPAGRRFTFHTDGNEIDRGEMLPEERVRLGTLQSLCAPGHHPSGHGR